MLKRAYPTLAALCTLATALLAAGCDDGFEAPSTADNLHISVVTLSLIDSDGDLAVSEQEAAAEVAYASDYWQRHCGIRLSHKAHYVVSADLEDVTSFPETEEELDVIHERFYDPHYMNIVFVNDVLYDSDGDPDTSVIGEGRFPWKDGGATLITSYGLGAYVLAHELGHDFGLLHVAEKEGKHPKTGARNFMESTLLDESDPHMTAEQCKEAIDYLVDDDTFGELCRPDSPTLSTYCDKTPKAQLMAEQTQDAMSKAQNWSPSQPLQLKIKPRASRLGKRVL